MKIEIHTLQWNSDHSVSESLEEPIEANVYCIAVIDGVRHDEVVAAKVNLAGDFTETWIQFVADTTVTSHTREEWEKLFGKATFAAARVMNGEDHLVATMDPPREPDPEYAVWLKEQKRQEREKEAWVNQEWPCSGPGYRHDAHGACPGYVYDRT